MKEKTLLRISLLVALTGLSSLILISQNLDIDKTSINTITPDQVGAGVKVCGSVTNKFTSKNGHRFFTLNEDEGSIKIVVFNSTKIGSFAWENLCVIGKVDLYQGSIEVIANEVSEYT